MLHPRVDDTMDSILNWYREEGVIFKGGSGSGINLSQIRSSAELLKGGGTASGPVSFMRGADASAGTIKSGGKTRRAAKMVILDVDHPDVEEFIWCKVKEERKARVLRDNGFDMDLDGSDSFSIQYQNANNSVRVTDEFMQAVAEDADWGLVAVTTGEVLRTVKARDLWRQIAQAAWECADPGLQFDTTINRWHTAHTTGASTAPTRARSTCTSTTRRATWRRSTCSTSSTTTATSTSTPSATPSRSCSRPRRSSSAGPTTRRRRSPRRAATSASSASATPTSAPC